MKNIKNYTAERLHRLGISADCMSGLGLLFAALSSFLIYEGLFLWAGVTVLMSGGIDLLDGAIARASKVVSPFGGILDSSLDRYGDGFIFSGILFYCLRVGSHWYAGLAMSVWVGSFLISYVRARAECVIANCRVGFWERGERLVYVALGLFFGNLPWVLWVLGIGTHATALFRIFYAYRSICSKKPFRPASPIANFFFQAGGRNNSQYLVKVGLLFLLVWLIHVDF